ncbi:hypothetical protein FGG08_003732 [Glutinoglossum americanum]|uniref:AB hydrolase-1 domain-containing protein n=1 Tax=Glutinoglossum americanum TaxID=1670608 RepID=A0A9P8IAJ7_9PEZI|nr:hypothetical protein FGG08_003732 [Glutinoglossum americanum]
MTDIHTVTSRDGTAIGYRQLGQGPGLVILHGAMESSQSHIQLAEALSPTFTVYLPDRRGRGQSGPYGSPFTIQTEVDDLSALLAKTAASNILGVSSGAIIALQACLQLPTIQRAAIFEPPLGIDRDSATQSLERYDAEMANGKTSAALVTAMRATEMGPPIFKYVPRWLLEQLTTMAMAHEGSSSPSPQSPDDSNSTTTPANMRALAPTLHYDFQISLSMSDDEAISNLSKVTTEVLLIGGSKSPTYLRSGLDRLEKVLPNINKRVVFAGLGHGATGNSDRRGQPALVAEELRGFFGE